MSGLYAAARAASEMEQARPYCTAKVLELREGWGVAITVRTRRGQRRWAGPVDEGWAWLRQAPAAEGARRPSAAGQFPGGEAVPGASPAGTTAALPPGYCGLCKKPVSECTCVRLAGSGGRDLPRHEGPQGLDDDQKAPLPEVADGAADGVPAGAGHLDQLGLGGEHGQRGQVTGPDGRLDDGGDAPPQEGVGIVVEVTEVESGHAGERSPGGTSRPGRE